ncbi:DUF4251 domain-containing protein [Prevotella sp. HUN102]|uniref:DUF4251 domain-containing protein n=1 Tax=Prevotella sp. HUN102 TaxID=1392486 RepID=UPI0004918A67|nr:DUF4251 domain-containing protein [Prevotella sp. HUN102]
MKKIMMLLLGAMLLVGCATVYYDSNGNPVPKEQVMHLKKKAVQGHLAERRYRIFVNRVYPIRGPSHDLRDDWGMEVSGDSVGLFLPYFGRVYQVPYGRGLGLNIITKLQSYEEEPIKNGIRIIMKARSEIESYHIVLEVFNDATVYLNVMPSGKEGISYSGVMELNDAFKVNK